MFQARYLCTVAGTLMHTVPSHAKYRESDRIPESDRSRIPPRVAAFVLTRSICFAALRSGRSTIYIGQRVDVCTSPCCVGTPENVKSATFFCSRFGATAGAADGRGTTPLGACVARARAIAARIRFLGKGCAPGTANATRELRSLLPPLAFPRF